MLLIHHTASLLPREKAISLCTCAAFHSLHGPVTILLLATAASRDAEEGLVSPSSRGNRASQNQRGNAQGRDITTHAVSSPSGSSHRQPPRGKRKAGVQDGTAQQAKHAQHVLKRKERVQSCPMCSAAQSMVACDKLDGLPFAQLKLIMG